MAKAAKAKAREAPKARRSHVDAERWNRTLIVGGVLAVILVAVGFIAFGWYQTQVRPLGKTVLRVGDTKFSLAHLERRMRLESPASAQNPLQVPDQVLDQLEREAILLEGAGELDITVTEEEFAAEIRERGNLAEDVQPSLFAAELRRQVDESGLREDEYRQMLRAQLLEEKVRNYFVFLAPEKEPQVRARWIVVDEETKATEAQLRLLAGEQFTSVAADLSLDTTTSQEDLEPSWLIRGSLLIPDRVEDFLFGAEPGEHSDVLSTGNLFYLALLLERDDERPLEEGQRAAAGNRNMGQWLEDVSATLDIKRDLSREDAIRALEDVL